MTNLEDFRSFIYAFSSHFIAAQSHSLKYNKIKVPANKFQIKDLVYGCFVVIKSILKLWKFRIGYEE